MLGNAIGVGAFVVFLLTWLGAGVWWIARLGPQIRELNRAAALVGFAFGEWPRT